MERGVSVSPISPIQRLLHFFVYVSPLRILQQGPERFRNVLLCKFVGCELNQPVMIVEVDVRETEAFV